MTPLPKKLPTQLPKHIHVIGICGVATSALAIAFHKAGVKVTGSDKGFFPPVSTELEKHGIPFYAGWHPEKMVADGVPDLVVVTTFSGNNNPETLYVKEHNIPHASYVEVFREYFIGKNSIVCAGTWGKTSSSALLSHILLEAGLDPGYMFGGVSLSHDSAARISDAPQAGGWSVFEGDEYKSGPNDPTAKFFYYKPSHLLLTAVSWDHADLYPTEEAYFAAFRKLIAELPKTGLIVANANNKGVMETVSGSSVQTIFYGVSDAEYTYHSVMQSENGLDFIVSHQATGGRADEHAIHSPMIGSFQAENITACFAMAHTIGIPAEKIIAAIASFKGLKRRLEKRLDGKSAKSGVTIFDDIAHSPEKASSVLRELRAIYKGKIVAIFEPNIGGRERDAAHKYDQAFASADTVIIPRLTKLKVASDGEIAPMEGEELAATIGKTHAGTRYIESDEKLVTFLAEHTKKGDVIAFLGSHGFRGMIESAIERLKD